jgi:hypothetical protein
MKRRDSVGLIAGVLKKMPLSGVAEIRVPSDIRRVLVANIEKLRENSLEIFANEISKVLAKVDFQRIIDDVLKNYTLRVEASIDLVPKGRKKTKKT